MNRTEPNILISRGQWFSMDKAPAIVIAAQSLVLLALVAVWAIPPLFKPRYPTAWALNGSVIVMVLELATLLCIGNVRAVALHTLAQCMRARIAVLFMAMLAMLLAVLPVVMKGDGTLAGQIKTFLSYGTSGTMLLLSIVTVLLAGGLIGDDIRLKQIFLTATKPLARWQYVLGRWLGLVMLTGALAVVSMTAVYMLSQYLRSRHGEINGEDRRQVETEVFVARANVDPDPRDIDSQVQQAIANLKRQGAFEAALEGWKIRTDGDPRVAEKYMIEDIRKNVTERNNSVGPGGGMSWTFSNIRTAGLELRGTAVVTEVDTAGPTVKLSAGAALLRRIVQDTPVRINGVPANASAVGDDYLVAVFVEDNLTRAGGTNLKGKTIELVVDSIIQITYKAVATGELPAESAASGETVKLLPSLWEIQNPSTGRADWGHRRDPVGRPATITVSSRAVGNDGKLTVRFTNLSNTSVRIAADDITVLYPKGDFAGSIIRSTALIVLQLMFLAAIGIWAGSFLSFPVACLVCLAVLPFSLARTFLTDAVRIDVAQVDWITTVAHYVNRFMSALLPDFGANWPSDWLVDGVYIPWAYVSISGVLMVAVRGLALLALACLIFRKRELARVQV